MNNQAVSSIHPLPTWFQASYAPSFPQILEPITVTFLTEAESILTSRPPRRVWAFFSTAEGGLKIKVTTHPPMTESLVHSLQCVSDHFENLGKEALHLSSLGEKFTGGLRESFALDLFDFDDQSEPTTSDESPDSLTQHNDNVCNDIDVEPPLVVSTDFCATDISSSMEAYKLEEYPLTADSDCIVTSANRNNESKNDDERMVTVFSGIQESHSALEAVSATRDVETSKRLKETMLRLKSLGPLRPFRMPVRDWRAKLDRLDLEYPNYREVIRTIVRPHLYMLSQGHLHRMVPLLLLSAPGVGKSQFARKLQEILDVPSIFLMMASETNSSSLSGSSTFWSNSSPGRGFEVVAWGNATSGGVANPLIILDEVDKVAENGDMKYDPMASLYGLLEVESAAKFEDQSVPGVQLDLSLGRFMLLANKADGLIPEPILSRVRTFHIQSPTADEMRAIAQRIYKSLRTKYELNLQPILSRSVLDEVVNLSPREVKTRLEAGIAIAAAEGKRELDLTSWRLTACEGSVKKTRMGYL